jgi:hypothetical protein
MDKIIERMWDILFSIPMLVCILFLNITISFVAQKEFFSRYEYTGLVTNTLFDWDWFTYTAIGAILPFILTLICLFSSIYFFIWLHFKVASVKSLKTKQILILATLIISPFIILKIILSAVALFSEYIIPGSVDNYWIAYFILSGGTSIMLVNTYYKSVLNIDETDETKMKQKEEVVKKNNESLLISLIEGLKQTKPTIPNILVFFIYLVIANVVYFGVQLNQSVPIIKIKDNPNTYIIYSKTDNLLSLKQINKDTNKLQSQYLEQSRKGLEYEQVKEIKLYEIKR